MPDIEFFCRLRRYNAENFNMSRQICEDAESKISAGPSRITPPAQLNEMVQYDSILRPFVTEFDDFKDQDMHLFLTFVIPADILRNDKALRSLLDPRVVCLFTTPLIMY